MKEQKDDGIWPQRQTEDENENKGSRERWRVAKRKRKRRQEPRQGLSDLRTLPDGVRDTIGQGQMPLAPGALHVGFSKATTVRLGAQDPLQFSTFCPCSPAPGL